VPSLLDKYSLDEPNPVVGMSLIDKYSQPDKTVQPEPTPANRTMSDFRTAPMNISLSGREVIKPTINSLSELSQEIIGEPDKQGLASNLARDAAVTIMSLSPIGIAQLVEGLTKDPVGNLGGMAKSIAETYDRFIRSGLFHDPAATLELGQVLAKRPFSELMNLAAPLGLVAGGKAIVGKFKGKSAIPEVTPTELPLDVQKPTIPVKEPPQVAPVEAKPAIPPVETPKPEMPVETPTKSVVEPVITDWTQRGDKLHKTESGAQAHMKAASAKYPDMEFKVVPEGKGFVLQQKAKAIPDEGQTFGTVGNPADIATAAGEKVPLNLKAMENRVESPQAKAMVSVLADVQAAGNQITGTWMKPLQRALNKLSNAEAETLMRARMERVRPADPKLATLYDNIGAIQKEVARRYGKANPDFADRMRIRESDLFPQSEYDVTHRLRPEIADQLQGDLDQLFTSVEKMAGDKPGEIALKDALQRRLDQGKLNLSKAGEAYLKHLEKIGVDRLQGILELRNFLGERTSLYRKFGPLHERRILDLPPDFLDLNAKHIIPQYLEGAGRETALAERFGKDLKGFSDALATMPAKDAAVIQRIMDFYTGNTKSALSPNLTHGINALTSLMYFKIGVKSVVKQFAQPFFSFMSEVGLTKSVKGFSKLITDNPGVWDDVYGSNVLNVDVLHNIGGAPGVAQKVPRVASKYMKGIGFRDANQANQFAGAVVYRQAILDMYEVANGRTAMAKVFKFQRERAQYLLEKRFGIDYTQPLTDVARQKGIYRGVTESQLQKNVLKETDLMNDPTFKGLFTLQKFNLKQAKMVKDMVLDEMRASKSIGGATAIAPLLRVISAGVLTGEGLTYLLNKYDSLLSGEPKERMDKSIAELYADPNFKDILIHCANNIATAGTGGFVSDLFSGSPTFTPKSMIDNIARGVKRLFVPVAANTAWEIGTAAQKALKSGVDVTEGKKTKGDVWSELGTDVASQISPDIGNAMKRTESEKSKVSRFQFQMSKLREMGYNDKAQDRIVEQLSRFSAPAKADLALAEYDRVYMEARKLAAAEKYDQADKVVATFFQRFPEFLNIPGKNMKLTGKVIREFLEDQKKREEKTSSKTKQSLIDQYK
jgi:hypothetical protein